MIVRQKTGLRQGEAPPGFQQKPVALQGLSGEDALRISRAPAALG